MRWVERLEGLATAGPADLGPLRVRLPAVLDTEERAVPPLGPSLAAEEAPPGERRFRLTTETEQWAFTVPILAPEISPPTGGVAGTSSPEVVLAHAPFAADALARLRTTPPNLIVLGNARALWNDGAAFAEAVRALRAGVGAEPLLWAPRVALPHRLALLVYLGLDVLDTTEGLRAAVDGRFLDPTLGELATPGDGPLPRCDCDGCSAGGPERLVAHARAMFRRSLEETRAAIDRGTLRELVEARLAAEPSNLEHLRHAQRALGDLFEERTPVTGAGRHSYVLAESAGRPEIVRFRSRLLERYRPPAGKSVLLLVPCSKTKPYHGSPSHRRFARALEGLEGLARVHLVSVSSPLGIVPRELEDMPPARHYDVPVTGDWSAAERGWVVDGVRHLLSTGAYRSVVAHLDPDEYAFVRDALPASLPSVWTLADHRTTTPEALAALRAAVADAAARAPEVAGGFRTTAVQEFAAVTDVQFGTGAGARLLAAPVRLLGRPWFLRLTDGHQDLATLREERGLVHLTVAGALRLGDRLPRVEAEPSLSLRGDLFVPGVIAADPAIRTGDSIGVVQGGTLAAVGEAALPGRLMRELRRGVAVRIRHRRHPPSDTDNTSGERDGQDGPVVEG